MTIVEFFRILNRNLNIFLLSSLALAVIVFFVSRNLPEYYKTRTEIFTGLVSGAGMADVSGRKTDYNVVNSQFENLITVVKSEQTLEEVGEKLFLQHISLAAPKKEVIGEDAWKALHDLLNADLLDSILVEADPDQSLANIRELKERHYDTWLVRQVFVNSSSAYSPAAIRDGLTIKRLGGSDLVELTYTWTDPGICQNTLRLTNEVFFKKLFEMKLGQSREVVRYFRDQLEESHKELQKAEDSLAAFRIRHKIINYDQQTQNIASLQSALESEYQQELRSRAAAQATVDQMEEKLKLNKRVIEFSEELLEKKKRLADLNARIAEMELYAKGAGQLDRLRTEAEKLEAELSNSVVKRYEYSRTTEGVSNKEVLQKWLSASMALDASEARLRVLANRSSTFQNAYDQFSPLGAELKRLERTVGIAESNYLQQNSSLNAALNRQQGEALSTGGLVVTVPPRFPLSPIRTQQMLLILLGAVVGFIVPFGLVLFAGFLDNTIRTPRRAEEQTGLKLLGAYPELDPGSDYKNVDMQWLRTKAVGHIAQNLRHERHRLDALEQSKNTRVVVFFSTRALEGKNFLAHTCANELVSLNKKVAVLTPRESEEDTGNYDLYTYKADQKFLQASSLVDIIPDKEKYDYVFFNLNAVLTHQYPIELIENADMAVCVVSAKRAWNKADESALREFSETLRVAPRLILNGVEPDFMDNVLGEIRKTRSAIRRFLKSVLTLQFGSRNLRKDKTALKGNN